MVVLMVLCLAAAAGFLFWRRHSASLRAAWRGHMNTKGYYTYPVYKKKTVV